MIKVVITSRRLDKWIRDFRCWLRGGHDYKHFWFIASESKYCGNCSQRQPDQK